MTTSILVLRKDEEAYALSKKLQESSIPIISLELIEPYRKKNDGLSSKTEQERSISELSNNSFIKRKTINDVNLLNPKLSQQDRQRTMSLWLMPFGFVAGITFSGMTNLNTFSKLGFGNFGEILIGGFLGMASGWIGSFFASSSVNPYKKDIESLRKKNEQGRWLLILKTPFEAELPWQIIKEISPIEVVRLSDI